MSQEQGWRDAFSTAVLALILAVLSTAVMAGQETNVAKERRQALDRIEREIFRKSLQARVDIRTAGPAPKTGRAMELTDGSFYVLADGGIAFEELGAVRVARASLRDKGRTLLLTLEPVSRIVPSGFENVGRELPVSVLAEADVDAAGGVREALATFVYLPGETPADDVVARCLARYPDQDAKRSRLRCGLAPE